MKFQRTLSAIAALSGLLGAASALADANSTPGNLVANGSMNFTDANGAPLEVGGPYYAGDNPNTLNGWTFIRPAGNAEYWNSFQMQPSADGGTYLGIQDLDAYAPRFNVQGISQTISGLQVGASYTLTFLSMSNHDGSGTYQAWDVSFGSQSQTSRATTPNTDDTGTWVQTTMSFKATSTSQVLTFLADYFPGSNPQMLDLDGVVLEKVSAVPEPSSWALLLAGVAGVSLAMRRSRNAR